MNKNYSIGFDIGSNSVGWAVLDEDLRLSRFKNQSMWGSRLFKESETAAERRIFRNTRRRYQRRKFRLHYLQELMDPLIQDVDPSFYQRLSQSSFHKNGEYNLFSSNEYDDKNYFEDYKTIYHLRNELMTKNQKADPRLLYLALHHIVKYRGHFLFEGQGLDVGSAQTVQDNLENIFGSKYDEVLKVLEADMTKNDKNKAVKKLYSDEEKDDQNYYQEMTKLVTNLSCNFKNIALVYTDEELDLKPKNIQSLYEKEDELETFFSEIPEEMAAKIEEAYKIYSWLLLQESLQGFTSISSAKINQYEEHQEDLVQTKCLLKSIGVSNEFFKNTGKGYDCYINGPKKINQEDLNKELIKLINKYADKLENHKNYDYVMSRALQNQLFPVQRSSDNAVIPYQIHFDEYQQILEKQAQYYPHIKDNLEKFNQVFLYRIPYYVGPINTKSKFSTAVLKNQETFKPLTPFNFEEIVDIEQSAEKFIRDRTSFCTYLPDQYVLPKSSLYYQLYEVYNELNGLSINGDKLSKNLKNMIVEDLFKNYKTVSHKRLETYLIKEGFFDRNDGIEIKGYQTANGFSTSLSSYVTLKNDFNLKETLEMVEDLILWNTVFTDKDILHVKISKAYPQLNDSQVKKILNQNFTGWEDYLRSC